MAPHLHQVPEWFGTLKTERKEEKMDDLAGKTLVELESFRDGLVRARLEYPSCCELGRDPLGGVQSKVLQDYDERIVAANREIEKRKSVEREAEMFAARAKDFAKFTNLCAAIHLLEEFGRVTQNILYRHQSPEQNAEQLRKIEEATAKLRRMAEELDSE